MKNSLLMLCSLMAALLLGSCSSTQKVTLDPISVHGARQGSQIYQASYTRLTDIIHTSLDLKLDWDSAYVIGRATIEAKPYIYPLSEVVFDAKGFRINQVSLMEGYDNKPLKYTYNNKKLTIQLGQKYSGQEKFKIQIDYVAMPEKLKIGTDINGPGNRGFYFVNRDNSEPGKPKQFWTQGETQNNSCWFPTIEDPQEKMTQDISITLPEGMVSLSNGLLDFSTDNGDGTHTDSWRQELPHSTYLTMLAGGDFRIAKDSWRDKEVSYYMEPQFADHAKLIFGKTPEMMEFFSNKLKVEYPWEKYAQIVLRDFTGGAMENTTATTFFEGMNMTPAEYLDENHEDIISHELFHHWFGNLVTSESWSNLALNESFATYGEYLWNEHKYGLDEADYKGWNDANAYFNTEQAKQADVIRFNYPDREQMFDVVSYQKGGRILHMLRKTVGDEAFFESLTLYLKRHSYKTAEIHDLRLAFEEVTGKDLNWFFNQWFLASGNPELEISNHYDAAGKKATVTVKQTQSLSAAPLYRLPVKIDFYVNSQVERQQVVVDKAVQSFSFDMLQEPELVNFDAEKYLLATKKENKTLAQYAVQYQQAPLFLDRMEALLAISKQPADKLSAPLIISALNDKHWAIRRLAVKSLASVSKEAQASAHDKVKDLALNDSRSYVRASAINVLRKVYKAEKNDETLSRAQQDVSPSVVKALSE